MLIDDFHYMDRAVQIEVAKSLKESVRLGIKIVTAAVLHRGDDVVRANPELRGRVRSIDLGYWSASELRKIADTGFTALNAIVEDNAIERFIDESAGSPQLMQLLLLQACFVLNLRERADTVLPKPITVDHTTLEQILLESGVLLENVVASHRKQIGLVGAVGIEPTSEAWEVSNFPIPFSSQG
jgi:hypothetical protein